MLASGGRALSSAQTSGLQHRARSARPTLSPQVVRPAAVSRQGRPNLSAAAAASEVEGRAAATRTAEPSERCPDGNGTETWSSNGDARGEVEPLGGNEESLWPSARAPRQKGLAQTTGATRQEVRDANGKSRKAATYDAVALSNLCVDVFMQTENLPQEPSHQRADLLARLSAAPPPVDSWEVGGNCNFLIAASRIGLHVASLGYVGDDVYGDYLQDVLQEENVTCLQPLSDQASVAETLLCFVLVDPASQHAFCSKYDLGPWPLLQGVTKLSESTRELLSNTNAVFINGFTFDELPPELVVEAAQVARAAGAAVLFDPGPRCWTLAEGRRDVMDAILGVADVVLMTEEEAEAVTGHPEAQWSAAELLERSSADWVIVKRGGAGALLLTADGGSYSAPGFDVQVGDTVGCGDSFAGAIAAGFARGWEPDVVLALANAVGAATATGSGAGRNVADAAAVGELLRSQGASDSPSGPRGRALALLRESLEQAARRRQ